MWRLLEACRNTDAGSRTRSAESNVTERYCSRFPTRSLDFVPHSFTIGGAGQHTPYRDVPGGTVRARPLGSGRAAGPAHTSGVRMAQGCRPGRDRSRGFHRQRRVSARARGVRSARAVAALGRRDRRHAPDDLQYRVDAIHAGHRGARLHGLHAHAPFVHGVGLGVRGALLLAAGVACVGRDGGRRDLLSLHATTRRIS